MQKKVAKLPFSAFDAKLLSSARNRQVTSVPDTCRRRRTMRCMSTLDTGESEVEVAGLRRALEGMKVDGIKRPVDRFVFHHGHGVMVLKSGPVLNLDWATDQIP